MRQAGTALLLALLAALCGCIDFERETVTYQHDQAGDRLLLLAVYEGIHGANGEQLADEEIKQLKEAFEQKRVFFWSNWLFSYNPKDIDEELDNIRKRLADPEQTKDLTPEAKAAWTEVLAAGQKVRENIRTENGRFYLNAEGKLCGYQTMEVTRFSEVVKLTNRIASLQVLHGNWGLNEETDMPETRKLQRAQAAKGFAWLRADGGQLRLAMPMTYEDFLAWKVKGVRELRDGLAQADKPREALVKDFDPLLQIAANEVQLVHQDGRAELWLGAPGNARTSLALDLPDKKYRPNLIAHVRATYGLEEKLDLPALRAAFFGAK